LHRYIAPLFLAPFETCHTEATTGFASELVAQYPDAKVILTVRPVEDWIASTRASSQKTAQIGIRWQTLPLCFCWDGLLMTHVLATTLGRYMAPMDIGRADNFGWRFEEHNAMIKGLVSSENLLVYHVSEGWYVSLFEFESS
jgi:hypothetical protein